MLPWLDSKSVRKRLPVQLLLVASKFESDECDGRLYSVGVPGFERLSFVCLCSVEDQQNSRRVPARRAVGILSSFCVSSAESEIKLCEGKKQTRAATAAYFRR